MRKGQAIIGWGAVAFLAIVLLLMSITIIPTGHKGVLLTWGKANPNELQEGLYWKIPVAQKVVKISTQTLKYEAEAGAASKDLQTVQSQVAVNYRIDASQASELYTSVGLQYQDRIIQPAVQETLKSITAKFAAEELITNREQVTFQVKESLYDKLNQRGLIVEAISITDFQFSEEFDKAIEAKVTAEQRKLQAERDLERIKIEAQQQIESAKAQAESLRLQKQEVTQGLLELRKTENQRLAIEKWDGVLPTVTGDSVPLIQLNSEVTTK